MSMPKVYSKIPDGYGFLRSAGYNYLAGPDGIYVSPAQIRIFALRKGDTVYGQIRMPRDNERFFAIMRVDTINGVPSGEAMRRVHFDNLTPLYPEKQIKLETTAEKLFDPRGRPGFPDRQRPAWPDCGATAYR